MVDARTWVASLPRRIEPGHPVFRHLAVGVWRDMAHARGATVEVTAIHRWITAHIADVTVDGVPYVLATRRSGGAYQVIARLESEVSGSTSDPDGPEVDEFDHTADGLGSPISCPGREASA